MNIGEAADVSGVSVKMIRHYEGIGLLPAAMRSGSGYRVYRPEDIHTLRFVRNARDLGFSLDEIGELLALWRDRSRASAEVKRLAEAHVVAIESKIRTMQAMVQTLRKLGAACHGDHHPDCPILDELSTGRRTPVQKSDQGATAHAARSARAKTLGEPRGVLTKPQTRRVVGG